MTLKEKIRSAVGIIGLAALIGGVGIASGNTYTGEQYPHRYRYLWINRYLLREELNNKYLIDGWKLANSQLSQHYISKKRELEKIKREIQKWEEDNPRLRKDYERLDDIGLAGGGAFTGGMFFLVGYYLSKPKKKNKFFK